MLPSQSPPTALRNHESFPYRRGIEIYRDAVDTRRSMGINLIRRGDRRVSARPSPKGSHASNVSDDGVHGWKLSFAEFSVATIRFVPRHRDGRYEKFSSRARREQGEEENGLSKSLSESRDREKAGGR